MPRIERRGRKTLRHAQLRRRPLRKMTDPKRLAQDLLHDCDRSARYHRARRTFLVWLHRITSTVVILSGSSAIVALHGFFGEEVKEVFLTFLIVLPTFLTAVTLVWSPADRARDHDLLARQFDYILRSINWRNANLEQIEVWRAEISRVGESEADYYHALNALCFNDATRARDQRPAYLLVVKWHQRLLRNIVRFSATNFPIEYQKYSS